MTIKIRDYQRDAAAFFAGEIAKEGGATIDMPTGTGRTIILAELARLTERPVAFVTRIPEMGEQMRRICDGMGISNVTVVVRPTDVSAFGVVILSEELRDLELDHPKVIRQGA
jgi:superfamily II DNA or RNA helicase